MPQEKRILQYAISPPSQRGGSLSCRAAILGRSLLNIESVIASTRRSPPPPFFLDNQEEAHTIPLDNGTHAHQPSTTHNTRGESAPCRRLRALQPTRAQNTKRSGRLHSAAVSRVSKPHSVLIRVPRKLSARPGQLEQKQASEQAFADVDPFGVRGSRARASELAHTVGSFHIGFLFFPAPRAR